MDGESFGRRDVVGIGAKGQNCFRADVAVIDGHGNSAQW